LAHGIAADARRVLSAASCLEEDPARVHAWYTDDPIVCLGNCTAECLVGKGRAMLVVRFLHDITSQERCTPQVHGGNVVDMTRRLRRMVRGS
jgi:hypothetical protein